MFGENVNHVREINLISPWNLIKAFYLPSEINQKKFETQFYEPKRAEAYKNKHFHGHTFYLFAPQS